MLSKWCYSRDEFYVGEFDLMIYVLNKEVFDVKDGVCVDVLMPAGIGVEIDKELVRNIASEKPNAWRIVIWREETREQPAWWSL